MVTNPKLRSTLARHCTSHNQFVHNQKRKLLPSRILSVINFHCMKSVQTRSFFWSVFSCIQSEQLRPLCYYCLCYFNTYYLHLFCDYYNTIININIVIITSHQYCLYLYYFTRKHISTDKLVKMAQFVLKNNFFEFNNVFQQISGTAIGAKFPQPCTCIFMDQIETNCLKTQSHQSVLWFRYIDSIFFYFDTW